MGGRLTFGAMSSQSPPVPPYSVLVFTVTGTKTSSGGGATRTASTSVKVEVKDGSPPAVQRAFTAAALYFGFFADPGAWFVFTTTLARD